MDDIVCVSSIVIIEKQTLALNIELNKVILDCVKVCVTLYEFEMHLLI